jgi:hypothetical protein
MRRGNSVPSGKDDWHPRENTLYWIEAILAKMRVAEDTPHVAPQKRHGFSGSAAIHPPARMEVPCTMWPKIHWLISPILKEVGMEVEVYRLYYRDHEQVLVQFSRARRRP